MFKEHAFLQLVSPLKPVNCKKRSGQGEDEQHTTFLTHEFLLFLLEECPCGFCFHSFCACGLSILLLCCSCSLLVETNLEMFA